VENLAEDADDDFQSCPIHNENHVLHPLLSERNDHGYELRRRRHERGLFLRPTIPNAILYTDGYINIGLCTNFTTSQLSIV